MDYATASKSIVVTVSGDDWTQTKEMNNLKAGDIVGLKITTQTGKNIKISIDLKANGHILAKSLSSGISGNALFIFPWTWIGTRNQVIPQQGNTVSIGIPIADGRSTQVVTTTPQIGLTPQNGNFSFSANVPSGTTVSFNTQITLSAEGLVPNSTFKAFNGSAEKPDNPSYSMPIADANGKWSASFTLSNSYSAGEYWYWIVDQNGTPSNKIIIKLK